MVGMGTAAPEVQVEYLDVLTKAGAHTGVSKPRSLVHKDGDYHRAVHVWIYVESTGQLLLQKRADCKESWPGLWDISSAGHISAGDTSLITARFLQHNSCVLQTDVYQFDNNATLKVKLQLQISSEWRELQEELGINFPDDAFEILFVYLQECVINDGTYINNEYNDVYLVTILEPLPLEAFSLQESEVSDVKYIAWRDYEEALRTNNSAYVPFDADGQYGLLFKTLRRRYEPDVKVQINSLQNQLGRYVPVLLEGELAELSAGDTLALSYTIQAAEILERLFLEQVWGINPLLKSWLEKHANDSELDKLKHSYFMINKSPWSCLDENEAFLTTADSAIREAENVASHLSTAVKYRAAFPITKPPGANFYPADLDREEFRLWKVALSEEAAKAAVDFFTVIRRSDASVEDYATNKLQVIPYSKEYGTFLAEAADFLYKAGSAAETPSLKRLLTTKADAFLSNDYHESDIAWMDLDSSVDVTIGPYETYEDTLFGYKATFEAFIGIRDQVATNQMKFFSEHLQVNSHEELASINRLSFERFQGALEMEDNLPLADKYKSKTVSASPIRVIQLVYNAGDVKGPQTVAFNLPNDESIVKERGSAMVILKNVSQAKFDRILLPIARICVAEAQRTNIEFNSFFLHTLCHECCHGIGPHNIVLPDGQHSTVRLELEELHSALEEAKADIVGLWALQYLIDQGLLSKDLEKAVYVSFLAGCFRSIRFGLQEAHGKGQALQFNWIFENGGFVQNGDKTFAVDFNKIKGAVESLSREIMTIQAQGNKVAARLLLERYAVLTPDLHGAINKLENFQIPVDIAPSFNILQLLEGKSLG